MADADLVTIRRALISVSDKTGLVELGQFLAGHGVEILSTGGSAKAMAAAGVPVKEVADHTGFPEIMDGRVKTLHPTIHGGLLARRDLPEHVQAMEANGIAPIDLLVVNLYPFEATVAKGADFDEAIENIDIGGPAMIRAAAKNHGFVAVVVDPADYAPLKQEMAENKGAVSLALRKKLAAAAYARTGAYDAAISTWFAGQLGDSFPRRIAIGGELKQVLRYGENPHQQAAFYTGGAPRIGIATATQLQGKELSFNNLNDTDAAFELVSEFTEPAVAIIKHANPCGVAQGKDVAEAYARALRCDPVSAFGGIIAVNRTLDAATTEQISRILTEVIIAPDADDEAKELLAKKKNLRLLLTGGMPDPHAGGMTLRSLAGGYLLQTRDNGHVTASDLKVVTKRQPTEKEIADLLFAFTVCKHVKSNAIVYVKDGATVGIGAGQMSRVDSSRIAARKSQDAAEAAGEKEPLTRGSVVASDAFFPFADGLLAAVEAGATAVIHPGGSMRDNEVIAAADEAGIAMVFTGMRHFRH
ncbi:bifunctional phosphoribosylaminoimidazolecarboxamide formyltransferase/IMP cyclohydrolase [Oceanibaculum indicum]|uniref:Bifunctional purine biosynthesis protein PurH n=1 Tax=Oceanibaculum indicum TaxID=526216 RepID=A0A420WC94_9PROT|nr:bifunctional phosphoribosylaminoimidazolecarboxamide formyltransferase/IMP cyclohydrolase [Oceanibaculum indicum]RKQ68560.1 phosphoribosylaminoimidazolecarboxamide formyltransferase/IMP cyclohydrolase [Oceanibaculum indicum]